MAGAVIAGAYTNWSWRYVVAGAAIGALVGAGLGFAAEAAYTALVSAGASEINNIDSNTSKVTKPVSKK